MKKSILILLLCILASSDYGNYCGNRISPYGIKPIDDIDDNCRIFKICSRGLPDGGSPETDCCKAQLAYLMMLSPKNRNSDAEAMRTKTIYDNMNNIIKCNTFTYMYNVGNIIRIAPVNVRTYGFNYYTIFDNQFMLKFETSYRNTFMVTRFDNYDLYLNYSYASYSDHYAFANRSGSIWMDYLYEPINDPIIVITNMRQTREEITIHDYSAEMIRQLKAANERLMADRIAYIALNGTYWHLLGDYRNANLINEGLNSIITSRSIAMIAIIFILATVIDIAILFGIMALRRYKKNKAIMINNINSNHESTKLLFEKV